MTRKPATHPASIGAVDLATAPTRSMVLWCPDWPVNAALNEAELPSDTAAALIHQGEVFACSAAARGNGVKRGLRVREAQSRCPELTVLPYDPGVDERNFEPVLAAVEAIMPGVHPIRPGCCAVRAQGPARYFGGEEAAAEVLLTSLSAMLGTQARIGIADGMFAAEQAARHASRIRRIAPGASREFLSSFPVATLQQPELLIVLEYLGLKTLGDLASLSQEKVRERFGATGEFAHQLARGEDLRALTPRWPAPPLEVEQEFEPAVERVDQLAFTVKASAERFIDQLDQEGLVCTELLVRLSLEGSGSQPGRHLERLWRHPRFFGPDDVVDRVRWQVQEGGSGTELRSGVLGIALIPEKTDLLSHHHRGLWGNGPAEEVHHGLSRVQSMLGHGAVLTAVLTGGRLLNRRRVLVPWGEAQPEHAAEKHAQPWPGALSGPAPATLFPVPLPVEVLSTEKSSITVDERNNLSAHPTFFAPEEESQRLINAWAGPWPLDERWWEAQGAQAHRFQIIDSADQAWLLLHKGGQWYAEARYD